MSEQKFLSPSSVQKPSVISIAEDILGCKWSLTVLQLVRQGICRPGAMERSVKGLTTKVLNERLRKLTNYNILQRHAYPEIPPRVEYRFTEFGLRFMPILDAIEALQCELEEPIDQGAVKSQTAV
ncbi:MAG: helix-turn-helix transcriptional regulator [Stenomitos rutilans HA7619-LM2]|jgi:DNA-binding HxlR family transcriptional regulator|nr:helix-turn-helix transcriptional regulator [Stenomitos rutilans HA7619-LM2]